MVLEQAKQTVKRLLQQLEQASNQKLQKKPSLEKTFYDFQAGKASYYHSTIEIGLRDVKQQLWSLCRHYEGNEAVLGKLIPLLAELGQKDHQKVQKQLQEILPLLDKLEIRQQKGAEAVKFTIPYYIPEEIKADIVADIKELERCYAAKCYRSCIVLCGRVLETALHRKYFEATNIDALEKTPGIGLGNLIAKMKEQHISLDPAITHQIHLINQVRIFSVHKKQEAFYPSKEQTQAIILYTLDVLGRIFLERKQYNS
ncbi:hypothetical protein HYS48_00720 [Candidatus Woesearchaeota archaeon]|nr:hypothetical protein [Candidatus Woesearchaeota archaeon]